MSDLSHVKIALPQGWNIYNTEDILLDRKGAIKIGPFGSQLKKEYMVDDGYKVYGQENVIEKDFKIGGRFLDITKFNQLKSCEIKSGDLVISMMGTIGKCEIVPNNIQQGIMDSHLLRLQINEQRCDKVLLKQLIGEFDLVKLQIARLSVGGIMDGLSSKVVKKLEFYLPPIGQQQKIAKILSTVDNMIEKTQALIDKYTAIKQGMMADLFTRGIDLSGTPDTNPNYGQLRPSYEQAPELYKETELGWVPKEWEVKPLRNLSLKIQDGTHFSPVTGGGDNLYLTSKNIRFGYLSLDNIETISKDQHDSIYKRCDVQEGDLLLTKDGANTGNVAINDIDKPFSMLSSVAFLRCNELSTEEYLLHYILSDITQGRIKDSMSGNAITRLTLEKINNFLVPAPFIKEQKCIAGKLSGLKSLIDNEKKYLDKLSIQKKGLMQDLLTGKIQVITTNST